MEEVEETDLVFCTVLTLDEMPMLMTGKAIDSLINGSKSDRECFINGEIIDDERDSNFECFDQSVCF